MTTAAMHVSSQLMGLLGSQHRRASLTLLTLMILGMALETLGVGLVIPAVMLMTQADFGESPVWDPVLSVLGNPTHEQLVIWGMATLVAVYAVKALFFLVLTWRQASFVAGVQQELSQRLYSGYLRQPYTFHLQRNSAQLIRNVTGEVSMLAGVTASVLVLASESLIVLGITILLLSVEPFGALFVVATLGSAGWGFHRLTRGHILRWGLARQHHDGLLIQHLQQGLGGAKDVKLLGREDNFVAQYQVHNASSARISQRQSVLQQSPRLWLELLAVIGLAALALIMLAQNKPVEAVLPALGLFAAAAYRLMTSAGRVIGAVQNLRYTAPVIAMLHGELRLLDSSPKSRRDEVLPFCRTLSLERVSYSYPTAKVPALREVSLMIPRGDTVGFVGSSGAGKSTLVDLILGLLTPDSGVVHVDNIDIQCNLRGWQDRIGYVPQAIFLTDDTLRRNVAFGLRNDQIDDQAVWRAIRAAQLEDFVASLPRGIDTLVGERGVRLSGGQRQRVGIARALYHDPQVLVLDEATSSLDLTTERSVMDAVRKLKRDKTILIVAHRLSTVAHCDRLFRLEQGRLVAEGDPDTMLGQEVRTNIKR